MILQNMIIHKGSKKYVVCAWEGGANTTPLFLISFATYFAGRNTNLGGGESEGGQKFIPPNPLSFCPTERTESFVPRVAWQLIISFKKGSREVYNYSTKRNLVRKGSVAVFLPSRKTAPQSKNRLCFCRKIPEFAPITI